MSAPRIAILPRVHGVGGMVSFFHKFSTALQRRGITVTQSLADAPPDAVLVIGGTRDILPLLRLKKKTRIVQRLDGINWIHRLRPISLKHTWRAETGNLTLAFIRRFVADRIVYQSEFSRQWWNGWYGALACPASVVYNAVDLNDYAPAASPLPGVDGYTLLVVEGSLGGGYENGLENAIRLAEAATARVNALLRLAVIGEVDSALRAQWQAQSQIPIDWLGKIPREAIPGHMRAAHALFSADVHPACPNSVIEALACGLPVVAYDTGSLSELVSPEAGFIAPYGSDPWKVGPPRVEPLAEGLERVLKNQPAFRLAARMRAETVFDLEMMVDKYLAALLG